MTSMDAGCLSRRRHSGPRCCWQRSAQIGTIQANFYGVIVTALNDGFCADILEAARHFYEIDPERQRAANQWGILLMEEGRLDEAETLFNASIRQHGKSGVFLSNLAGIRQAQRRRQG